MKNLIPINKGLYTPPSLTSLEKYFLSTSDGIIALDRQYRVVFVNQSFKNLYQIHLKKIISIGDDFINFCDHKFHLQIVEQIKAAEVGIHVDEVSALSHQNKTVYYKVSVQHIELHLKETAKFLVKVLDVTNQQIEQEIVRRKEVLFNTFIDHSSDILLLLDKDFVITYCSYAIQEITDKTPDQFLGLSLYEIIIPSDKSEIDSWRIKLLREFNTSQRVEFRIHDKNKNSRFLEAFGKNMLNNEDINSIIVSCRDIQAKKVADEALILAEQRLSLLLNNTEESFIILNSRLRVLTYNKAAQEHSKYFFQQELQSGSSYFELIKEADVEKMIVLCEKVFDGESVESETSFKDAFGNYHIYSHKLRPLSNGNDITGIFITSSDITERKLAEEKLKESEIRFKTILQESFDAVLITNELGLVTYSSPSIVNILGIEAEQFLNYHLEDFVHEEHKDSFRKAYRSFKNNSTEEFYGDFKFITKFGEDIWVELKAKNMLSNPSIKGLMFSLRDISSRKAAQELTFLSEQRFKGLVQSGADMISIIDEQGYVVYSSPNVTRILGNDPVTDFGKNVFDYIHPSDLEWIKEKFQKLLEDGAYQDFFDPYRFPNANGEYRWLETVVTNLMDDPAVNGIVLNTRDITERKKLSEELALNTKRLQNAMGIAKLGYLEFDLETQHFFCSKQFYDIIEVGHESSSILKLSQIQQFIHEEDRANLMNLVNHCFTTKENFYADFRLITANGIEKYVVANGTVKLDDEGKVSKFELTIQDITESKKAAKALELMENRFKVLFESSVDAVMISIAGGQIISVNKAMCDLVGYSRNELLQMTAPNLLPKKHQLVHKMLEVREQTGSFKGEVVVVHKNNTEIPVEVSTVLIKDNVDEPVSFTILRDIREKKKVEQEQKVLTEELLKNNKDLQQFSYITSHNLRAPIANLQSLLSLFNKSDLNDPFNRTLVEKFEEATGQLQETLNDLINILVIKSNTNIEKEELSFEATLNNVKKHINNLLEQNHGVLKSDFTQAPTIEYNKVHLESIFMNLISNSIKYRSPERRLEINIQSYQKPGWIILEFEDNGVGFDAARYKDRIFGLYQRFHNTTEGKGIGLYIVKSQVEALGGNINVQSSEGVGTKFTIHFKAI